MHKVFATYHSGPISDPKRAFELQG